MHGIDISNWQPSINVVAVPADFVIIKATGGAGFINRHMPEQLEQAKAAGRKVGLYHFARDGWTNTTPEQEAHHFLNRVTAHLGDVVLVLDWEADNVHDIAWAARWLNIVTEATGTRPLIYITLSTANSYDWSAVAKHHPLWLAWYWDNGIIHGHQDRAAPGVNHWGIPAIWQYTQHGRLPGYDGDLDLNIAYTNPWADDLRILRDGRETPTMTVIKRHPVDRPSISQEFAASSDRGIHLGIDYRPDYPGQTDFPVYAAHDGFVVFARGTAHVAGNPWEQIPGNGNNGNSVIIQAVAPHQACATSYNHLGTIAVKEGQWVTAGTFLGYMGWTGFVIGQWGWNGWQTDRNPSGTHLHFELFIDYGNGQYPAGTSYGRVNPLEYFDVATIVPVRPGASGETSTTTPDTDPLEEIMAFFKDRAEFSAWMQEQVVHAFKNNPDLMNDLAERVLTRKVQRYTVKDGRAVPEKGRQTTLAWEAGNRNQIDSRILAAAGTAAKQVGVDPATLAQAVADELVKGQTVNLDVSATLTPKEQA